MTAYPILTKDDLRKIHLYSYEDVQELLEVYRTLEREMEKPPEEMDMDLVDECLAYIELVMGEGNKTDEAMLDTKYQQALATLAERNAQHPSKAVEPQKHGKRNFFLILAAAIATLIGTLTIAAKVYGYKNAWEFVYQKAVEIMELDTGEVVESEGITLICDGETKIYPSFEELLENEGLDILYPQNLPSNLSFKTIYKTHYEDTNYSLIIDFENSSTSIIVRNYFATDLKTLDSDKFYIESNNTLFYLKEYPDGTWQATCQHNGFEYSITCSDYDTLIILLQNMKGSNP